MDVKVVPLRSGWGYLVFGSNGRIYSAPRPNPPANIDYQAKGFLGLQSVPEQSHRESLSCHTTGVREFGYYTPHYPRTVINKINIIYIYEPVYVSHSPVLDQGYGTGVPSFSTPRLVPLARVTDYVPR